MKSAHLVHVTIIVPKCLEWQAKLIGQAGREKSTDDDGCKFPPLEGNDYQPFDLLQNKNLRAKHCHACLSEGAKAYGQACVNNEVTLNHAKVLKLLSVMLHLHKQRNGTAFEMRLLCFVFLIDQLTNNSQAFART